MTAVPSAFSNMDEAEDVDEVREHGRAVSYLVVALRYVTAQADGVTGRGRPSLFAGVTCWVEVDGVALIDDVALSISAQRSAGERGAAGVPGSSGTRIRVDGAKWRPADGSHCRGVRG